jgi:ubiquinone/menaquinone biosynthesis C-methylase UbiE
MTIYDHFAHFYEADFGSYTDDLPVYRGLAGLTGGPLLELMCGSGRVLLRLAAEGYTATGVDESAQMLALARQKAAAAGVEERVTLIQADISAVDLPGGQFGLAMIPFNSFGHLQTHEEQIGALARARRALRPGGLLVVAITPPSPGAPQSTSEPQPARVYELDGRQIVKYVGYYDDLATHTARVLLRYQELDPGGEETIYEVRYTQRWWTRAELEALFVEAGFRPYAAYGSYACDPYREGDPHLIVVGQAPEAADGAATSERAQP